MTRRPASWWGLFAGRASSQLSATPSYKPGVHLGDLGQALPSYAIEAIREALPAFGKKIKGFDMADAVLTGVETRTSSPLKITAARIAKPQHRRPLPGRRRRQLRRRICRPAWTIRRAKRWRGVAGLRATLPTACSRPLARPLVLAQGSAGPSGCSCPPPFGLPLDPRLAARPVTTSTYLGHRP